MAMYTSARQQEILAQAHANLAKHDRTSAREYEVVYKRHDDAVVERSAAVASGSEQGEPWKQWVESHVDARLNEVGEAIIEAVFSHFGPKTKELKRENELLQREVTQLREQVGLERGLKDLRSEVEQARSEVPKLPTVVQRLEEGQARLHGEIATTKDALKRVRIDQSLTDRRLSKLSEATAARSTAMEMKIERTSFEMREVDPAAAAALRNFATATLGARQDEKIWILPGPAGGTA